MNAYLLIIIASIIWGSGGIFIKIIGLPSTSISFMRAVIPTLATFIYLSSRKMKLFTSNTKLIFIGSIAYAIENLFFFIGFLLTSVGNGVIILYTWPLFASLIGIFFIKEFVSRKQILLTILGFIGVIIINLGNQFSFSNRDFLGMSSMLLAAFQHGVFIHLFKKILEGSTKAHAIFYQNFAGALIFLPFIFINRPFPTTNQFILSTTYASLIGLFAFFLFFQALKNMKASTASAISYVEVVSAITFGIIILGETISIFQIVGGAFILASAFLLSRIPQNHK